MREIKFRLWDNVGKEMRFVNQIHFRGGLPYKVRCGVDFVCEGMDILLMQHTGLKDKNGVEIYEGDVLKHTWDFGTGEVPVKTLIQWDVRISGWSFFSSSGFDSTKTEIIGNIYENPELL